MIFKTVLGSSCFRAWGVARLILLGLYLVLMTTFSLYSILESFPNILNLVNLQKIRYYAQRAEYLSDPTLVFVPRRGERVINTTEFRGDGYSTAYGVEVPPIQYHASYTRDGFRTNSSTPPFDILVIGDSYVEIGESDDSTLSELLKQASGLSALNLGRGWYGPPQYLEVFKRYGLGMKAKYALLCFFSGNDAEDTRQYVRWQRVGEGGDYYSFIVGRKNFFIRYLHAFRDTYFVIRDWIKGYFTGGPGTTGVPFANGPIAKGVHPDLGMIQLNGQVVPMRFDYWNQHATSEQLLSRDEWKTLRTVMAEFRAVALENEIVPIVVFIPTKAEVYASLFSEQSGQGFLLKIRDQLQFEMNSAEALEAVAGEQGIRIVNVLPHFKELARQGKVLYYPFDTHWNIGGRQAAAEVIAKVVLGIRK
jgi:SGNH hydrolase-like domain, acetyltransferase AlgX